MSDLPRGWTLKPGSGGYTHAAVAYRHGDLDGYFAVQGNSENEVTEAAWAFVGGRKPPPWSIEDHDGADKSFKIDGPLPLYVDYDDVFHAGTDFLAERVVQVLNEYMPEAPYAYRCHGDEYFMPEGGTWEDETYCGDRLFDEAGECPVCHEDLIREEAFAS